MWATPQARDSKGVPSHGFMNKRLPRDVKRWPTPRAVEGSNGGGWQRDPKGNVAMTLTGAAKTFPTLSPSPLWPTPLSRAAEAGVSTKPPSTKREGSPDLTQRVANWPTPAARDYKGANSPAHLAKTRGHHDQLPNAVALWNSLPDPAPSSSGPPSSPSGQTSPQQNSSETMRRRLNPDFVTWLMGWPEGWSRP